MTTATEIRKPEHLTVDQWIASLQFDRRVLLAQLRREVHTRGNTVGRAIDRIDRALAACRNPHS